MIECVLFDFDETLTRRDTTRIWLNAFARVYPLRVAINARHLLGLYRAKYAPEKLQDAKFRMIGSMLRGLSPDDLVPVNEGYVSGVRQNLRPVAWKAMVAHLAAGRHVLVVTASPRTAVKHVFAGIEVETLGTEFACENGLFTGALYGEGCFGAEKKAIIESWAANRDERIAFVEAWSDSLSDAPMMRMAERRKWICPPADANQISLNDPTGLVVSDQVNNRVGGEGKMLWKFRWLGKSDSLRKLAYFLYQILYAGRTVTISRGPLKGMKWAYERGQQFWLPLGLYEPETVSWLVENIKEGDLFFDIGANWGYFTLVGSRLVGSKGTVISIEPIPKNQDYISRQISANGLSNIELQKVAVSNKKGIAMFAIEAQNANSHLSSIDIQHAESQKVDEVEVQTTTLDSLVQQLGRRPDVIKCDVEGAERLVAEGAQDLIKASVSKWIISTHSLELKVGITKMFESNGYKVSELEGFEHEIICYPPKVG